MEPAKLLPLLLGAAWLAPLASFVLVVLFGPRMGRHGRYAGHLATAAIMVAFVLSAVAMGVWLTHHPLATAEHEHAAQSEEAAAHEVAEHEPAAAVEPVSGEWYSLAAFGNLHLSIGYYIDALTLAMFCMVTFVASCIHVYSSGYMHEELHDVTDPLVPLADGRPLVRHGRYCRFYQYMSLFCFSMLGLVVAGNLLMVFVFWELVGICSYFLIGFYRERRSASNAANKAFIVNRVGDFGMLIGLSVIWCCLGTFTFADGKDAQGHVQHGIFSRIRPGEDHVLRVPDGMLEAANQPDVARMVRGSDSGGAYVLFLLGGPSGMFPQHTGYWLLVLAGLGVFCGCVGKSAQFPLHVWLPDAMEGPTPVSALIHAATMVAAGVYLVGRCYPLFTPEVLLVIAYTGCITLLLAGTIAVTATDIKRVLAYSTVSQLGYMMLALGVGGWVAGLFHLFTHAFFKSLLFLCSGSVIHACGTNEMPQMGGLRRKMPWTAGTMLVGCLAISGVGIPVINIGLSGYYSKDSILAQALSFKNVTPAHAWLYWAAVGGAALTSFYMFRLWFMTFGGQPRDKHIYEHAHESPKAMYVPLVILAVLAVISGWSLTGAHPFGLTALLEQARPLCTTVVAKGGYFWPAVQMPAERAAEVYHVQISQLAFTMMAVGFLVAWGFYSLRAFDPDDLRRWFAPLYQLLRNKWYFDEIYAAVFVRPVLFVSRRVADFDVYGIDFVADSVALGTRAISGIDDWIDRWFVDGAVNLSARLIYGAGIRLRGLQTGNLRQYVVFIVVGTVALFVLVSLYWNYTTAGVF